jgi:hypothetical protein
MLSGSVIVLGRVIRLAGENAGQISSSFLEFPAFYDPRRANKNVENAVVFDTLRCVGDCHGSL